jgi:hypothetical protein
MNTAIKNMRVGAIVFAAILIFAVSAPKAFADDPNDMGNAGYDNYASTGSDNYAAPSYDNYASTGWDNYSSPGYDNYASTGYDNFASTGSDNFASPGYDNFSSTGSDNFASTGSDNFGTADVYGNTITQEDGGVGYTYEAYGNTTDTTSYGSSGGSYGGGSFGGGSFGGGFSGGSAPMSFSAPRSYYSAPAVSYSAPQQIIQQAQRPIQQQPFIVTQPGNTAVTTTNNTCTNNSCNYTDNSINHSFNTTGSYNTTTVIPVAQTPVTYPVQYVYPQNYTQTPSCTITLSYNGYNSGYNNSAATLTWSSTYATSAYISPSVGNVAPSGSRTVYANPGTIYTMGVSGQGGSGRCQTTYTYTNNYVSTPYVSLSQIPYTGFDFGPLGNALYWLSLLAFAAAGAYLLVYYKGGAAIFAGAATKRSSARIQPAILSPIQIVEKKVVTPIAKKIEHVIAPVSNLPTHEVRNMTTDTMVFARSSGKEAPRIVISRS